MKKNKCWIELIIINSVFVFFYFLILKNLYINISNEIMFSTPDSGTYKEVCNWIVDHKQTNETRIRPFLYPLLMALFYKPLGATGLWLMQFLLWIGSVNLLYYSIKTVTGNLILSIIGILIFAANLTYISLTLHALTEVTTIFLLTLLIFYIIRNSGSYKETKFFHIILFILILLTLIKPMFNPWVYLLILVGIPAFYLKQYIAHPLKILILFIVLSPLAGQIFIMKKNYDTCSVSDIGSHTLKYYLFAQGVLVIDNTSYNEAVEKIKNYSNKEIYDYMMEHKKVFYKYYTMNIVENIDSKPVFLAYPPEFKHELFFNFMRASNHIYLQIQYLFAFFTLISIIIQALTKKFHALFLTLFLLSLIYYIFLVSGISWGQGDRLTLPALPVWIVLYCFVLYTLLTGLKSFHFEISSLKGRGLSGFHN